MVGFPAAKQVDWRLLVEVASQSARVPLDDVQRGVQGRGKGQGLVVDGTVAGAKAQRSSFWRPHEEQPDEQRLEGADLNHDILGRPGWIAEFVVIGAEFCGAMVPGTGINLFVHLADGNTQ